MMHDNVNRMMRSSPMSYVNAGLTALVLNYTSGVDNRIKDLEAQVRELRTTISLMRSYQEGERPRKTPSIDQAKSQT